MYPINFTFAASSNVMNSDSSILPQITLSSTDQKKIIHENLLAKNLINKDFTMNFDRWIFPQIPNFLSVDIPQAFHLYWNKINPHRYIVTDEISRQVRDYLCKACKNNEIDIDNFLREVRGRIYEKELSFRQIVQHNWNKNANRYRERAYINFECLGGWVNYLLTHSERWINEALSLLFNVNGFNYPLPFKCSPSLYRPELDMKVFIRNDLNPNLINDEFLLDYLELFTGEVENSFYYRVLFEHLILKNGKSYPSSLISNEENQLDILFVQSPAPFRLFGTDEITINLDYYFSQNILLFKFNDIRKFYQALLNIYFNVDQISTEANDKGIPKLISKITQGVHISSGCSEVFDRKSTYYRPLAELFLDHYKYHYYGDTQRFFVFMINAFLVLSKVEQRHLQSIPEIFEKIEKVIKSCHSPFLSTLRTLIEDYPFWNYAFEDFVGLAALMNLEQFQKISHEYDQIKLGIEPNLSIFLTKPLIDSAIALLEKFPTLLPFVNKKVQDFRLVNIEYRCLYSERFFMFLHLGCLKATEAPSLFQMLKTLCLAHPLQIFQDFIKTDMGVPYSHFIIYFGTHSLYQKTIEERLLSSEGANIKNNDLKIICDFYFNYNLSFSFKFITHLIQKSAIKWFLVEKLFKYFRNTSHHLQLYYNFILENCERFPIMILQSFVTSQHQILEEILSLDLANCLLIKKIEKFKIKVLIDFFYEKLLQGDKYDLIIKTHPNDFKGFFAWILTERLKDISRYFSDISKVIEEKKIIENVIKYLEQFSKKEDVAKIVEFLFILENCQNKFVLKENFLNLLSEKIGFFHLEDRSNFLKLLSKSFFIRCYKSHWREYFTHLFDCLGEQSLQELTNLLPRFSEFNDVNLCGELCQVLLAKKNIFNHREKNEIQNFFSSLISLLMSRKVNLFIVVGVGLELKVSIKQKIVQNAFETYSYSKIKESLNSFSDFFAYFDLYLNKINLNEGVLEDYYQYLILLLEDKKLSNALLKKYVLNFFSRIFKLERTLFNKFFEPKKVFSPSLLSLFFDSSFQEDFQEQNNHCKSFIAILLKILKRAITDKPERKSEVKSLIKFLFDRSIELKTNEFRGDWFQLFHHFEIEDYSLYSRALKTCNLSQSYHDKFFIQELQKYFCSFVYQEEERGYLDYFNSQLTKESWSKAIQIEETVSLPILNRELIRKIDSFYKNMQILPNDFYTILNNLLANIDINKDNLFLFSNIIKNYIFCMICHKEALLLASQWERSVVQLTQVFTVFLDRIKNTPLRVPFVVFLRITANTFIKPLEEQIITVLFEEVFRTKEIVLYNFICKKINKCFVLYGRSLISNSIKNNLVKFTLLRKEFSRDAALDLDCYDKLFDYCHHHILEKDHFELFRAGLQFITTKSGRIFNNEILKEITFKTHKKFSKEERTAILLHFSLLLNDQSFSSIQEWKTNSRFFQLLHPQDYVKIFYNLAKKTQAKEDKEYLLKILNDEMASLIEKDFYENFKTIYSEIMLSNEWAFSYQITTALRFVLLMSLKKEIKKFIYFKTAHQVGFNPAESFFTWLDGHEKLSVEFFSDSLNQDLCTNHASVFNTIIEGLFTKFALNQILSFSENKLELSTLKKEMLKLWAYLYEHVQEPFIESTLALIEIILKQQNLKTLHQFKILISTFLSFLLSQDCRNLEFEIHHKLLQSVQSFLFHPVWEQEKSLKEYDFFCNDLVHYYAIQLNFLEQNILVAETLLFKNYLQNKISKINEEEVDFIRPYLIEIVKRNHQNFIIPILTFVYLFSSKCREFEGQWIELCHTLIPLLFKNPEQSIDSRQADFKMLQSSFTCSYFFSFFVIGLMNYEERTFENIFKPLIQGYLGVLKSSVDNKIRANIFKEFTTLLLTWYEKNFLCHNQSSLVQEFGDLFDQYLQTYPTVIKHLDIPLHHSLNLLISNIFTKNEFKLKVKQWKELIDHCSKQHRLN